MSGGGGDGAWMFAERNGLLLDDSFTLLDLVQRYFVPSLADVFNRGTSFFFTHAMHCLSRSCIDPSTPMVWGIPPRLKYHAVFMAEQAAHRTAA